MANYCYNSASVEGSKEMLDLLELRVAEATKETPHLWYETYYTVLNQPVQDEDVYDAFGSKWFDIDIQRFNDTHLTISGSSAWSPVCEFFRKLSEIYQLHINSEFEECGNDFGGWYIVKNGQVLEDKTVSYDEYLWTNDRDYAYEKFLEHIEDGYVFDSVEDLQKDFMWSVISDAQKEEAVKLFNKIKNDK